MKYENFKGKYKVGDLFKSKAKREDCEYNFNTNSVIELCFDDQSSAPKFRGYQEDKIDNWFVCVKDIRPLTKKELKIYKLGDVVSKDKTKTPPKIKKS